MQTVFVSQSRHLTQSQLNWKKLQLIISQSLAELPQWLRCRSSVELLPRARTAASCPPSRLSRHLQSTGGSLPHDRRLHHRSCGMPWLATVALHRRPAEGTAQLSAPAARVMHVLRATRQQRQHLRSHTATALTCRRADTPVFLPHNSLDLWLTLGCKRYTRYILTRTVSIKQNF